MIDPTRLRKLAAEDTQLSYVRTALLEAADEIERLRLALREIEAETMREGGRWPHLKRVVALQCRTALTQNEPND